MNISIQETKWFYQVQPHFHLQLKEALRYLQSMFIKEEIRKRPDRAEADRFYNYPYVALEEALANAVYHKDYAQREPIEI